MEDLGCRQQALAVLPGAVRAGGVVEGENLG